ncbi:hypothetical protein HK099_005319 [Clydaea vesicula]|uniref:Uncharacterized protein n=1 Tax=Clydaea vesicula TaxID=447962 RepID=A0AAD5U0H1_9FUNG|nr:hypothetical protein HK099_005319 [Clydaea vesicula]
MLQKHTHRSETMDNSAASNSNEVKIEIKEEKTSGTKDENVEKKVDKEAIFPSPFVVKPKEFILDSLIYSKLSLGILDLYAYLFKLDGRLQKLKEKERLRKEKIIGEERLKVLSSLPSVKNLPLPKLD